MPVPSLSCYCPATSTVLCALRRLRHEDVIPATVAGKHAEAQGRNDDRDRKRVVASERRRLTFNEAQKCP